MTPFDLSPTSSLVFLFLTLLGLAAFVESMRIRIEALLWGRFENRFDHWFKRLMQTLKYAIGQYRMPQELAAGLLHIFIFAGFVVVSLRTLTLFGVGITGSASFHFPFLDEQSLSGQIYALLKDLLSALVVVGCVGFACRRLIFRPVRMRKMPQAEAVLILGFILTLMITDFFMDGLQRATAGGNSLWPAPCGSLVARWMPANQAGAGFFHLNLWLHSLLILVFLNYLPYGKHFHIITSFPNAFFGRLTPYGRLEPIRNIESAMEKAIEGGSNLGVKEVEDLTWKMILDAYTCTECGRCVPQCPAWATGKPLSLREVNINTRHHLQEKFTACEGRLPETSAVPSLWQGGPMTGGTISEETIWSCTLCRDCEERCPVLIEMVPRVVEMRRYFSLMESSFPAELGRMFTGIERHSNPWGIAQADRGKWLEGTSVMRMSDNPDVEYLFYVGCMGSYDDRSIKTTRALTTILEAAGVKFGVLAEEENCNGEVLRRLGNEYLAQLLITANVECFEKYKVKKIVTNCPHCFNTLRNEYPDFGGCYQVEHSSELVLQLIREKRIAVRADGMDSVAFHDPCFLGRYNGILEPPRKLIQSSGGRLCEPSLFGKHSFCCGAGGGRMWMEEKEPRVSTARFDAIYSSCREPRIIGVACPFCRTMLNDASKARGKDEQVQVKDIVEIIAEHLV